MSVREFIDAAGIAWRAWDVQSAVPRRVLHRRKRDQLAYTGEERRVRRDRRFRRARTPSAWLAFASTAEKRRLYPIPPDWSTGTDDDMRRWCSEAVPPPLYVDWVDPPNDNPDTPPPIQPVT